MKRKVLGRKVLPVSLVVAICLVGSFLAHQSKAKQEQRLVRITYVETVRMPDGELKTKGKRIRTIELSSGQYFEADYAPDGQQRDSLLVSKQGIFVIRKDMIQPTDEFKSPQSFSGESVKNGAVGTAQILGYTAYIKKSGSGSVEVWTAPEFSAHVPLKLIMHSADGASYTQLEAVEISWEAGKPDGFFNLPDLPVDTSKIEARLNRAREMKDQRGIERYSNLLARWRR